MEIRNKTKSQANLIHSITSPIAINDCANVVLALGAKPIMAEHPREVAEITSIAIALTVSYANITDARMKSIMISGATARERGIPSVIDVVGVTCSRMRMQEARKFIRECKPSVIKGNVSEIKAIAGAEFENKGIDVGKKDAVSKEDRAGLHAFAQVLKRYARETGAIVVATGEVDVITDGIRCCYIYNGSPNMAKITGTGCMLCCMLGVYLATVDSQDQAGQFAAAVLSVITMGVAGELADAGKGLGSYHVSFLDQLSLMTDDVLMAHAKYEICF